jgi:hypothetical protein
LYGTWRQTISGRGVHTPARNLRCQQIERIECYYPQQRRTVQVTVPKEQLLLAKLQWL